MNGGDGMNGGGGGGSSNAPEAMPGGGSEGGGDGGASGNGGNGGNAHGGAIYVENGGSLTVIDNDIVNNNVTGGLGGTPDDITREAVAFAFGVECIEIPDLAARLRSRFAAKGLAEYAARWACIPRGAVPLDNPLGGAPGFVLGNVWVMPGLPSEMEAMFDSLAGGLAGDPIGAWRRSYRSGEGQIVHLLEEATRRFPAVSIGSYPRFLPDGPEVDVVLKCADAGTLQEATDWLEAELDLAVRTSAAGT